MVLLVNSTKNLRGNTNPLVLKNFQKIELDSILSSSFYETDIKPDKDIIRKNYKIMSLRNRQKSLTNYETAIYY